MLSLDRHITLDKAAIQSSNLASRFESEDLKKIGDWVWQGYDRDKQSRDRWEKRMSAAMDLAMQIMKDKNYPWPNCSNVAFPLVTIGALQFHARAYPTIISGTDVVKCRVIGEDPDGSQKARADRVSCHMSWQLLEQDQPWESQQDALLINLPIVGCAFKKSYWSGGLSHNISELVLAKDLVVDYYAKSIESASRKTHCIPLDRNTIYERVRRGTFTNVLEEAWYKGLPSVIQSTGGEAKAGVDRRAGVQHPSSPDETTPFQGLEQHVNLDLDGDGYAEPYIITIEESSKCVLRIVTRFDREEDIERNDRGEVIRINPIEYFTKYSFIPSPEGSIYDIGFGIFLGPLNEAVNSTINMMLDAGHMSMGSPKFLGRGAKIRGGVYTFSPFQMIRVDSSGDDLRKNIVDVDVKEPSAVLFQLLTLLINYTQRIAGTTDIMVGENIGQNTPKGTADLLQAEGSKIYSSIFKRVWRGMKEEFRKLYVLNAMYLPAVVAYGQGRKAMREDYLGDPNTIAPAADPNIVSEQQDIQRATAVAQRAAMVPGYDKDEAERRWLKAMKIDAPDMVFKGMQGQPPPEDPKVTMLKMELAAEAQEADKQRQHEMGQFVAEMQSDLILIQAKAKELETKSAALLMDVQGDREDRQVAIAQSQMAMAREQLQQQAEKVSARIKMMLGQMDMLKKQSDVEVARKKGQIAVDVTAAKGAIAIKQAEDKRRLVIEESQ